MKAVMILAEKPDEIWQAKIGDFKFFNELMEIHEELISQKTFVLLEKLVSKIQQKEVEKASTTVAHFSRWVIAMFKYAQENGCISEKQKAVLIKNGNSSPKRGKTEQKNRMKNCIDEPNKSYRS